MSQIELPCLFMRAGTSRGPFFNAADLPRDPAARDRALIAALGSGPDGRQLDGVGGGDSLTSKAAIVGKSKHSGVDVDYVFAQVATDGSYVDSTPTCGNMLSGVGPYAIETGLVAAADGETVVRIRDVNGGGLVEAVVQTPGGRVAYAGVARIDGVAGTAAPIALNFANIVGSKTGAMFPTGRRTDVVEGVSVTCIDVATPMVLIRAADLGLTGYEAPDVLNGARDLFARVERIRLAAARRMGLGDASKTVLPKVALLAPPKQGGAISSRYLTPWTAHKAHAVSGAICIAATCAEPGTVAVALCAAGSRAAYDIEHPAGQIRIALERAEGVGGGKIARAGVVRTARLLMRGGIAIPTDALCRQDASRAA